MPGTDRQMLHTADIRSRSGERGGTRLVTDELKGYAAVADIGEIGGCGDVSLRVSEGQISMALQGV